LGPNALRLSRGLEGTKRTLIRLLLLFNKYNRDQLQIQTHSEISHAMRPLSLSVSVPIPKPPENILAITNLIMKFTDSKKRKSWLRS